MSTVLQEQYLKNFNNFISQLKIIFPKENFDIIDSMTDEDKLSNGNKFVNSFEDDNFTLFSKSKIKVFSHKSAETQKISESLFGAEFCLKNILNNQSDDVKNIIWQNLHTMYIVAELQKSVELQNQERLSILNKLLHKDDIEVEDELPEHSNEKPQGKGVNKKIHDMLGVNINKETTEMIDEIVGSFEKIMTKGAGSNPMSSIMEISKLISVKYADKISNGTIEIDKLMDAIGKKIPGMDKIMDQVMGMMKNTGEKKKPKEKIIIDENFSTSSVKVGEVKDDKDKGGFKLGSMLKMADQFGVIPGGKKNESDLGGGLASLLGGISGGSDMGQLPGMDKLMGMMQKMTSAETPEQASALKEEMDTFMQKELGVDMSQLNQQLDEFTNKIKDATDSKDDTDTNKEQPQ
jgi:hypothetical protein